MFNAKVIEQFLSKEDCEYLIKAAIISNLWQTAGHEFWDNRVINYDRLGQHDKHAAEIMLDANIRCKEKIKEEYGVEFIYADTLQVIRWFPGMEQSPHADDMSNTEVEGHRHRAFGSVIYLNEEYEGGHTYYPNFNFEVIPKVGTLAVHPGDPEHLHGVTKIENGIRYTIASFWTKDKNFGHEWKTY